MQQAQAQQRLRRALASFDATGFTARHGGYKESQSEHSHEYLLSCPYCGSERLRWNHPTKAAWICWGCHKSGDTLSLIELLEQCGRAEAQDIVLDGYHGGDGSLEVGEIRTRKPKSRAPKVLKRVEWPSGVDVLAPQVALHAPGVLYLRGRGVDDRTMVERKLGFGRFGWLRDRVVFPCYMDGALVYWQARAIWNDDGRGDYRKTLNPSTRDGGAGVSEVLYGFDTARTHGDVVVCEGPMDAVKIGPQAVALLGKTAHGSKLARLVRMRARSYTVYLDPEAQEEARAVARALSAYAPTTVAQGPPGTDPGDLTEAQNLEVIRAAQPYRRLAL